MYDPTSTRIAMEAVRESLLDWCAENRESEEWECPQQIAEAISRIDKELAHGREWSEIP